VTVKYFVGYALRSFFKTMFVLIIGVTSAWTVGIRRIWMARRLSRPCALDPGNYCRDDDFDVFSTTHANIVCCNCFVVVKTRKLFAMRTPKRQQPSAHWIGV
jgi:hypothetical protein